MNSGVQSTDRSLRTMTYMYIQPKWERGTG